MDEDDGRAIPDFERADLHVIALEAVSMFSRCSADVVP